MQEISSSLSSVQSFAALMLVATTVLSPAADSRAAREVTHDDLNDGRVVIIGQLGIPMGTVVEIEAIVVEAESLPWLPGESRGFLLRVELVNGHPLDEAPLMRFNSDITSVWVAPTRFELDKLIDALRTPGGRTRSDLESKSLVTVEPLSEDQIEAFKRSYVGSRHKLCVYEAGRFDGVPEVLPEGCETLGPLPPFGLSTYLSVLGER